MSTSIYLVRGGMAYWAFKKRSYLYLIEHIKEEEMQLANHPKPHFQQISWVKTSEGWVNSDWMIHYLQS